MPIHMISISNTVGLVFVSGYYSKCMDVDDNEIAFFQRLLENSRTFFIYFSLDGILFLDRASGVLAQSKPF